MKRNSLWTPDMLDERVTAPSICKAWVSIDMIAAGGPGCSSELAVFYENGPYHIKEDLTLEPNPDGWDAAGSIIFVDQVLLTCQAL